MTLDQFTSFICSKTGQPDEPSRAACAGFLQARYRMVWDSLLWRDARTLAAVTATGPTVAVPSGVERVVSVRATPGAGSPLPYDASYLEAVDDAALMAALPEVFEQQGTPRYYEEFADVDDPAQPRKLRLFPAPTPVFPAALLIAGKRPFTGFADGSSSPVLRNVDNALLTFATGDMLERQRQYGKAQLKFAEAAAHLAAMVKLESNQGGQITRLIPSA